MLTMKGKYGLKAMLHLARLPGAELALSADIARDNAISKKFLDAILRELRIAGLVATRKGRAGGYRLSRAPGEITLRKGSRDATARAQARVKNLV